MKRIPVYVVVPPRMLLLDMAGPLEVLRVANRDQSEVRFDVRYVGPSASVVSSVGMTLAEIEPLPETLPGDAMVVLPGDVDYMMMPAGQAAPKRDDAGGAAIVKWLRAHVRPGHKVVSICSGALLAGKAGLLDGYSCTTHHSSCAELAEVAPNARVLENRLYVEDGERYSSAGVTAGVDLMLHIVSQMTDHALAVSIARFLVVYLRRSGSDPQMSPWLEGRNHLHPVVHRAQDAMIADPAKGWTLGALARIAGASSRHLTRLFQEYAGMSISDYKNGLRVALARELISQTNLDMEQVAERAGFGSTRQLRRAWGRLYGTAPRDARSHVVL
ncbi:AraC family transcriptional regulator with amidase-like domain [Edaphobacter aggregans]|uniref:AraC family transcriptional regulator with amidase-like domain n=1 Tax=Edaphobacter aggregans TaxID=570835 RepID=A0A428MIP8_9BACT|nr:helix-turn-helix domain-containing protein [Edaphobacter aggregans]RSL16613.1 AraC family transcriptional regulator with amidase-like domain [Edaphobacter aggregans]